MPVSETETGKETKVPKNPEGESASRLLAWADANENAEVVEPAGGIVQAELAVLSVTVQAHDATVAVRVLPRFVQEDHERLIFGSRRLPVLLGEADTVLVGRTFQTFVLQDLETLFVAERASRVDDFHLVFPRIVAGFQREVLLRDPVVEGKAQRGRDLVGVLGSAHLHGEDGRIKTKGIGIRHNATPSTSC